MHLSIIKFHDREYRLNIEDRNAHVGRNKPRNGTRVSIIARRQNAQRYPLSARITGAYHMMSKYMPLKMA